MSEQRYQSHLQRLVDRRHSDGLERRDGNRESRSGRQLYEYTTSTCLQTAGHVLITDPPINGGTVTNGALLGSYMAYMFLTTAGQMGAPTTDQTQQQGHLTLPHA